MARSSPNEAPPVLGSLHKTEKRNAFVRGAEEEELLGTHGLEHMGLGKGWNGTLKMVAAQRSN
jgi:hypothetical protein